MIATKLRNALGGDLSYWVRVVCVQASIALIAEFILGGLSAPLSFHSRIARSLGLTLVLAVLHSFAGRAFHRFRIRDMRLQVWLYLLLLLSVVMLGFGRLIVVALVHYADMDTLLRGIREASLWYALPYVATVLIAQAVMGLQCGLLLSLMQTFVVIAYSPAPALHGGMILATSLVGCLSFVRVRSRSAYLWSALAMTSISIPISISAFLMAPGGGVVDCIAGVLACAFGAALSAFLAVGLTPIVEFLGGYSSDMRLIEIATLDHPLLKELSIQAPGTWNHSMVMGMMVESAADAIGANPVICRVGAYFHDIGKSKKPLYFVENQEGGENRHEKLSASMSALIIRSHVKDGLELARRHRVPRVIQDMIEQHHGTSVIEFFYEKARREADENGVGADAVDRSLYTYAGPRPQTREAGLLMLADGIEAAARTLSDPCADRIQGMVQKMINRVFASGELNECELTLRDLHCIAKSFTRTLTGIYHQRIAYAEPAEKFSDGARSETVSSPSNVQRLDVGRRTRRTEDLRRLGIE